MGRPKKTATKATTRTRKKRVSAPVEEMVQEKVEAVAEKAPVIIEKLVEVPRSCISAITNPVTKSFAEDLLARFKKIMPDATEDTLFESLVLQFIKESRVVRPKLIAARLADGVKRVRRGLRP